MTTTETGRRGRDLAGGLLRPLLVFGLPTLAVPGTGFGGFPYGAKIADNHRG